MLPLAYNPGDTSYVAANDPRSEQCQLSTAPDRDQIDTTEYDALGRVIRTSRLLENRGSSPQWETTLYGYDSLGRQVRVIRSASQPDYDMSINPSLSAYVISDEADQDILTQTVYDDHGRTLYTQYPLGVRTWTAYDGLGRQVKTIASAVGTATDDGTDDPRSSSYTPSDATDEDLITRTVYDSDGRVQSTEDAIGRVTRLVYGSLGRQVRTITNYAEQGSTGPADWEWSVANARWEDGNSNPIDHGTGNDQNRISTTLYDLAGRVTSARDATGNETRYTYDRLGRQVKTITHYVDGVFSGAAPDEDLISETVYNKVGQVTATIDARGTQTHFTYDALGRRLAVTQAAGSNLESTDYTCYDKAGRVLRTIANWISNPDDPSPDEQDESGAWLFAPTRHGLYNDQNRITQYFYDSIGRQVAVVDPQGNQQQTTYDRNGQVTIVTDAEGVDTIYRYDNVRRRTLVVQNFVDNGEDPSEWTWDGVTDDRWEESDGTPIAYGTDNDQNVIVQVIYDKGGRMTHLRDPNGNETEYTYDRLGRRLSLTNPLEVTWTTTYHDLTGGKTQTQLTYPGINGGSDYTVERAFDRLGRLTSIQYGDPAITPDVVFSYDAGGSRERMSEYSGAGFTDLIRETHYQHDGMRRLTQVGLDSNGDSSIDETVSYEYDAGGLRTKLILPGNLEVTYVYDAKGQLIRLTDWDDQETRFAYDQAGRHIATQRDNGLRSRYTYDAAGHLRRLRHTADQRTLGHFEYEVDGRGNREQALEVLPHPATTADTVIPFDDASILYRGSWTDASPFKRTEHFGDSLMVMFYGSEIAFTYGIGPDHSIFDVYIGKTLYQSYDGYSASSGEETVTLSLEGEGPSLFELRNRSERNTASNGYKLRFKQLTVRDVAYDLHTIHYTYDNLSRLIEADYDSGSTVYSYGYDLAGNLVNMDGVTRTFNAANQMTHDGTNSLTYDDNGNLTDDGVNDYTWDRANRLLEVDNGTPAELTAYAYDGIGNRISQAIGTSSPTVTQFLLDIQPSLVKVLAQTTGGNTDRYVHAPRGIHAMQDNAGDWSYMAQDGLGSIRSEIDSLLSVSAVQNYAPFGETFGSVGSFDSPFAFTGEQVDPTGQLYLRARYYNPSLGVFPSLDPFEGVMGQPMSLNGYSWVEGNTPNMVDLDGTCANRTLGEPASRDETTRCRRLVGALRGVTYRVTLTQDEGLEFDDVWTTTRVDQVWEAVRAIDSAYKSQNLDFLSVLGDMSMTMKGASQSYCGLTPGSTNISWYQCAGFNNPYSADNIIHELGHILQNRAGSINGFSMAATWDAIERRSQFQDEIEVNPGLGFATPQLRQNGRALALNPQDRWAEEVSDMFLFWTRGYGFSTRDDDNGMVGDLRRAFVNGETIAFDEANGGPVENPGIVGWSMQASGTRGSEATNPGTTLIDFLLPIDPGEHCIDLPSMFTTLV